MYIIYICIFFFVMSSIFFLVVKKKKIHVLIYFIDLDSCFMSSRFLFYVLYNHWFLIHVMDNALAIL